MRERMTWSLEVLLFRITGLHPPVAKALKLLETQYSAQLAPKMMTMGEVQRCRWGSWSRRQRHANKSSSPLELIEVGWNLTSEVEKGIVTLDSGMCMVGQIATEHTCLYEAVNIVQALCLPQTGGFDHPAAFPRHLVWSTGQPQKPWRIPRRNSSMEAGIAEVLKDPPQRTDNRMTSTVVSSFLAMASTLLATASNL